MGGKCSPTLHEQATKAIILMMIAKGKIVHLATHGSAVAGFLAFAGLGSSRSGNPVHESTILIYPEDIERMSISPALVVLSSCDSGRGTVKGDGILGMARAFILAGARAVPPLAGAVALKYSCIWLIYLDKQTCNLSKWLLGTAECHHSKSNQCSHKRSRWLARQEISALGWLHSMP